MENTQPKRKRIFLRIIAVIAAVLLIFFIILRCTHVILRIGKKYTTFLENGIYVSGYDIDENDIKEIRYLERLKSAEFFKTDIRNYDFLSSLSSLKWLRIYEDPNDQEHVADGIPSLENCPDLRTLFLEADVKNLDFIADNQNIEFVSVHPNNTTLEDISGLNNKPELEYLILYNVDCSDMSPLLGLEKLKSLTVIGTMIPDEIMEKLTERGVEIDNLNVEDYEKQAEEKQRQEEEEQKKLHELTEAYWQRPDVKRARYLKTALAALSGILIVLIAIRRHRESKKSSG